MSGNDLMGGAGSSDPTLPWRVALSMAMKLLFNADVQSPTQAIAMLESVQPNPEHVEDFGGIYQDVQTLAKDAHDETYFPLSSYVRRWT